MKSLSMSSMEMLEDEITAENWKKQAVETMKVSILSPKLRCIVFFTVYCSI